MALLKGTSIWGRGDRVILDQISTINPQGVWLDLGAGDGRYVPELLRSVSRLYACDIDRGSLDNLKKLVGKSEKLQTRVVDLRKRLPFVNQCIDGVFCTGSLHFFNHDDLKHIFSEVERVLKPSGIFIFDFTTDIQRFFFKKRNCYRPPELNYSSSDSLRLLSVSLLKFRITSIQKSSFFDDLSTVPGFYHQSRGNFFLVTCRPLAFQRVPIIHLDILSFFRLMFNRLRFWKLNFSKTDIVV